MDSSSVFISYANEDVESARRLNRDLCREGFDVWFDKESILPGQRWEQEIRKGIESSRYFLALISVHSAKPNRYVQQEFQRALEILKEYPESEIFLIPARLDETLPFQKEFKELQCTDLFPDWNSGLAKIVLAMQLDLKLRMAALDASKSSDAPLDVSNLEDQQFLSVMSHMKYLDRDLEKSGGSGGPWNLGSHRTRYLISERGRLFNDLRESISRNNVRAKEIIDSMGR